MEFTLRMKDGQTNCVVKGGIDMAKTFEQSIAELEEIVEQLENGDVTLDESLGL